MKKRIHQGIALLATLLLTGALLAGCTPSETEKPMTDADKANFKGGPMPADYKDPTMPGNAPPPAAGAGAPGAGAPPAAGAPNK